jgi:serine/threonine protein kinase/tetratricopeptide (TPR) repeat protein
MEDERRERVKHLCLAALERGENERQAFLEDACGQDEALLHEVESLLAYHRDAKDFLEYPPLELAASLLPKGDSTPDYSSDSDCDPMIGKTVSHYRILENLGAGGMGVVYKAEDTKLGRFVALKFLPGAALGLSSRLSDDTGMNRQALERLQREARASSALDHPNICTVYEVDQHEGSAFIAMQFLAGNTLRQEINGSPLPAQRMVDLGIQVANGLEAAHAAGIIHRDIKSANIFVTRRGEVKILDFGLAKSAARGAAQSEVAPGNGHPQSDSGASLPGQPALAGESAALGTASYMSPEQILGQPVDTRTDLFSFGVVLYEMATGRLPFQGQTPEAILDGILHQKPALPSESNPGLPGNLGRIIGKAIEKDRDLRYQTASELRDDLRQIQPPPAPALQNGRLSRTKRYWLLIALITVIATASTWVYFHLRRRAQARLGVQDAIVLADFSNTTGDGVFDETLKQALRVQLEQSPLLNVLSDQKVAQQLRYMGRPRDTRLTADVAREVCLRSGGKAMLTGSISSLGSHYVLGITVVNCQTGDSLASEQVEADNRERVLWAVDQVSTKLRARLGESLSSIQKYDAPVEQATTGSLEALRSYSLGVKTRLTEGDKGALPLFARATELDPGFAMAYARMGNGYFNLGQGAAADAAIRKSYELHGNVSERERLFIDSHYYMIVTGELDKAVSLLELWQQIYPRDQVTYTDLGIMYAVLGQYEKDLAEQTAALQLDPGSGIVYANLAGAYRELNQLDKSEEVLAQAQARKISGSLLLPALYNLAFLRGDSEAMKRQVAGAMGQPQSEGLLLGLQADTEAYYGHSVKARKFTQQAVEAALRASQTEAASGFQLEQAFREGEFGNLRQARKDLATALATDPKQEASALAALALARTGETERAIAMAHDLNRQTPLDTVLNSYWLPTIYAAVELNRGRPAKAIELLQACGPYELGVQQVPTSGALFPVYLRGLAFLGEGQSAQATVEFQKMIDHSGIVRNFPLGALARLGLARAEAIATKDSAARARAKSDYQAFLVSWKDADPDIPILKEARAEYGKLQ